MCFICCSLIACFSILVSTWMAHNARWCHSCGWSAHNQCGYIVSLQWRPRLVLCPPGGLLQLWPVVYATMCTSHFIVIFVLHCIQWFCTIALYFHLVFSLFVVCWYPYIFIDVLPCTLMFLCEIRAIKISYCIVSYRIGKHSKKSKESFLCWCTRGEWHKPNIIWRSICCRSESQRCA